MQRGVVHLKKILGFVDQNRDHPEAYRMDGSSRLGDDYRALCRVALSNSDPPVPELGGFYLWGFYNHKKFWVNVYLGKAGNEAKGKHAHLSERLYKELTAERAFAWRAFCDKTVVINLDPNYPTEVRRALRKAGSTHIFWLTTPHLNGKGIEFVENDLIETLNPTGNRMRRLPPRTSRGETYKVLNLFREMIHDEKNRSSTFPLDYHRNFWEWIGQTDPPTP